MSASELWLPKPPNWRDPWHDFVKNGPDYIAEARLAREHANHHNGFRVGALALATDSEGSIATFWGANQNKLSGDNNTKVCAEQVAMEKMIRRGFNHLVAMFVSGPPQPDTHSGLETPTLHSCGIDRRIMWDEPAVKHDTLIVSVHPERDVFEIYEHEELQTMHALPGELTPQSFEDPEFRIWSAAVPAYERTIDAVIGMTEGSEPPRAHIARLAVSGRIAPQAPPGA